MSAESLQVPGQGHVICLPYIQLRNICRSQPPLSLGIIEALVLACSLLSRPAVLLSRHLVCCEVGVYASAYFRDGHLHGSCHLHVAYPAEEVASLDGLASRGLLSVSGCGRHLP